MRTLGRNAESGLASLDRAGKRVQDQARRKQYAFARRHWRWLSSIGALCLLPNGVSLFYGSDFVDGLILGVTLSWAGFLVVSTVVMLTGTAPTMMGAEAERWTAEEVDDLRQHGFQVVHHAALRPGDIDHVLIGPSGAFVLETKWRSGSWTRGAAADATRQAQRNAQSLRLFGKRLGVDRVTSVVVLWGQDAAELPVPPLGWQPTDDTSVVLSGMHLRRWLLSLSAGVLSREQIDALHEQVREHAERRDARDAPSPMSLSEVATAIARPLVAVYLALMSAALFRELPYFGDIAVILTGLVAGLALRRQDRWRVAGTGVLTVQSFFLVVVLADLVI